MNHPYLDSLQVHIDRFESEHDLFTYGHVLKRLRNHIFRLYESDNDESANIRSVEALLDDGRGIYNTVWLNDDGRSISWGDRWELIDVIHDVEHTYWTRWYEGKLLPCVWKGKTYEPKGNHDGVSISCYAARQGRKRQAWKWSHDEYGDWFMKSSSKCWKDQRGKGRNKRTTQYRPVSA